MGRKLTSSSVVELFPKKLSQLDSSTLAILWSDGKEKKYPVRNLRLACRCAACVDEHTGEARLNPDTIPQDVHPKKIEPVGRYALQIYWSDGHSSGLYSFDYLYSLI